MRSSFFSLCLLAKVLLAGWVVGSFLCANLPEVSAETPNDFLRRKTPERLEGVVEKVVRPDLIRLKDGQKIRLAGVATLPIPRNKIVDDDQKGPYGFQVKKEVNPETSVPEQAMMFLKDTLEDQNITMEYDIEKRDTDSMQIAYVFLKDGTFVNTELVRHGFANLKITPPNLKYADQLRKAYKEARKEKRGLHNEY